jgi:hypothetical protein
MVDASIEAVGVGFEFLSNFKRIWTSHSRCARLLDQQALITMPIPVSSSASLRPFPVRRQHSLG